MAYSHRVIFCFQLDFGEDDSDDDDDDDEDDDEEETPKKPVGKSPATGKQVSPNHRQHVQIIAL